MSAGELPARVSRDLYPFRGALFDRGDGIRMHAIDEGPRAADPVVMVHGNPTWSFYFRRLVRELAPRHRCVVPDHVGCGLSDKPGDDRYRYTLASRVDDLTRLLDHLGVRERVTLIAHDWGGMIGMAWATRHPERVERLVMMNTAAFHLPEAKRFPAALRFARDTSLGALLVERFNAFARGAAFIAPKTKLAADVRAAYVAPYEAPGDRIATLRFVQDIPLGPEDPSYAIVSETEARLPSFAGKPVMLAWGLRDFVFDAHFLDVWRRVYPHAEVHAYADAGHYVLDDAADRIVAALHAFLAKHPLPAKPPG